MSLFTELSSLLSGEQYNCIRPDTSIIMDNFTHKEFNYIRTANVYFTKPVYKSRWKKISSSEYNYHRSSWVNSISLSQAKGLLKYTQTSMVF